MADLTHGPELDEAIANAPGPDELGICESALHSRTNAVIDDALTFASDPEERSVTRKALLDLGKPSTDDDVSAVQLRSAVGSAFSQGIAVGLALAEQRSRG